MLRFLSIKRLAVIDAVEVEFDAGLNVLTGETGAGKSILVEAVGLLLGGRASADLVRTGEESAAIEAIFETGPDELIVRREITAQGRSRAFINGELATAGALRDLAGRLVELHGQHEHQTLLDPASHLHVLDAFGGHQDALEATAAAYEEMRGAAEALGALRRAASDRGARRDLAAFQLAEIEKANLHAAADGRAGEDVELAATRQVLANAERVERLCLESYASLYESEGAVLGALGAVWRRVGELADLDPQFRPYFEARDAIKSQLEDLAMLLRRYADGIEASPARLQQVEERLALLERLKRKYGPTLADVIARRDALRRDVDDLEHADERLAALEGAHRAARDRFLAAARQLGSARRSAATRFARALEAVLAELAMERTAFEVRFASEPMAESTWGANGIDQAEFFLSPNVGEDLRPLARIVSGGELSRVMLAIKTLSAETKVLQSPGLIFDEVDAGIGGRVADVVGQKLRALGRTFQVLCITHLPQIAAAANVHVQIEKHVAGGRTRTSVRRLDERARIEELARMLAGGGVTDTVRASAREMIARYHGVEGRGAQAVAGESPKLALGRASHPNAGATPASGESQSSKSEGESERAKAKGRKRKVGRGAEIPD